MIILLPTLTILLICEVSATTPENLLWNLRLAKVCLEEESSCLFQLNVMSLQIQRILNDFPTIERLTLQNCTPFLENLRRVSRSLEKNLMELLCTNENHMRKKGYCWDSNLRTGRLFKAIEILG